MTEQRGENRRSLRQRGAARSAAHGRAVRDSCALPPLPLSTRSCSSACSVARSLSVQLRLSFPVSTLRPPSDSQARFRSAASRSVANRRWSSFSCEASEGVRDTQRPPEAAAAGGHVTLLSVRPDSAHSLPGPSNFPAFSFASDAHATQSAFMGKVASFGRKREKGLSLSALPSENNAADGRRGSRQAGIRQAKRPPPDLMNSRAQSLSFSGRAALMMPH